MTDVFVFLAETNWPIDLIWSDPACLYHFGWYIWLYTGTQLIQIVFSFRTPLPSPPFPREKGLYFSQERNLELGGWWVREFPDDKGIQALSWFSFLPVRLVYSALKGRYFISRFKSVFQAGSREDSWYKHLANFQGCVSHKAELSHMATSSGKGTWRRGHC